MEKYENNGKGGYFRFDDDNNMSYIYILSITLLMHIIIEQCFDGTFDIGQIKLRNSLILCKDRYVYKSVCLILM